MQFTAAQQAAISARNPDVLVSAAAGSGKTAVLVERVLSLLREGGRIDRMLIVTFTRAAAGEMRERLSDKLEKEGEKDPHLRRQFMLMPRARICTLHVFCYGILREHFEAVGIDPMCRIADQDKLEAMHKRAVDQAMEEMYASPDADARALAEQFEDAQIEQMLRQTENFLLAQAEPFVWAEKSIRENSLEKWMQLLSRVALDHLAGAEEMMGRMEQMAGRFGFPEKYQPTVELDGQLTRQMIREARQGTANGGEIAFAKLSSKKAQPTDDAELTERYRACREEWKKRVKEARALLPGDMEKARADIEHTLPALRAIFALAKRSMELYFSLKQSRNYLDYSDLEHLTIKALQQDAVRQDVASRFDALFVDEYQDVSGIQEAILTALHQDQNNMMFMVGDVKQSIYRFRLADPTLFLQKYNTYSEEANAPGRKIIFQQNFRSDDNVLQAVNQVFMHAMREKETEIEYDEAARLYPGGNKRAGAPVEIILLHGEEEEDGESTGELKKAYRYEAALVARKIKEMMHTVQVAEGKGSRPLRYRDIALLIRNASGRAPYIAKALQQAGIPVYSDADAQFYDLPEVTDMMNLLRVIDNPLQDIPLLSTLRCPCFDFSEEELARIRLVDQTPHAPFHQAFVKLMEENSPLARKARDAWQQLCEWRFCAVHLPLERLMSRVMEESGLYMRAGAQEDGELRQANLRLLTERAQGEAAADGLSAFLREVNRLHAGDDMKTAKTLGENEDVVRILTMHKSKGLQFPVVFLLETARQFNKDRETTLRLHMRHGAALKYVDAEKRLTRETFAQQALKVMEKKEQIAEEARLLYVAMTRAEERLIIIGAPKKMGACLEKWRQPPTAYAAGHASCMLDWIMQSLEGGKEGQFEAVNGSIWRMTFEKADENTFLLRQHMDVPALAVDKPDEKTLARMERPLPPADTLKTSVSALVKSIRMQEDAWESPADKRIMQEESPVPSFIAQEDITPALRGTITHRVLGLMEMHLAANGQYREAMEELQKRNLLTSAERNAVRLTWLKGFYQSELGKRMFLSPQVQREWAFNLAGENHTLIQGVIDLCFREGDKWVLVDYKTDHAEPEEILERYRMQMQMYRKALEKITGMPVKETWLFALRSGCAILVE